MTVTLQYGTTQTLNNEKNETNKIPLYKNPKIFFAMCVMKTKQIMSKSMMYDGSDALSLMSVRHFLMKILNLEKKVEKCAGTV